MAKDPAFLFYVTDFNDGTQDFTNEEVGAYLRILLFQFSQGHLPMERIKRKLGSEFEKIWPMISSKFKQDAEGNFFNERLEFEQNKRKSFSESRRNNISKRYEKQVNNISNTHEPTYVEHMENENENRNDIVIEVKKKRSAKKKKEIFVPIELDSVVQNENWPTFEKFNWIKENCPKVLTHFKTPLNEKTLNFLVGKYGGVAVKKKLFAIESKSDDYLKGYDNVNAILRNWISDEPEIDKASAIGQDVWSKNLNDLRKMREIRENNNLKLTQ